MTTSRELARWKKSSYSAQTDNCVEVSADLDAVRDSKHPASTIRLSHAAISTFVNALKASDLDWKKSSYSSQTVNCVEVSADLGAVRDSKHPTSVIRFSPTAVALFVDALK